MNDQDRRLSIAQKVWSAQYRFVGDDNAKKIMCRIDAGVSPTEIAEETKGELNLDLAQAVETLASAMILIKMAIQIYEQLSATNKYAPTDDDVRKVMEAKRPDLVESIANWLQKLAAILKELRR